MGIASAVGRHDAAGDVEMAVDARRSMPGYAGAQRVLTLIETAGLADPVLALPKSSDPSPAVD